MSTPESASLAIAQTAFQEFEQGLTKGKWALFLARLTDDFSFWFPAGPFKGLNQGKEKAQAFLESVNRVFPDGLTLEVIRVLTADNDNTVLFEVRSQGLVQGTWYENQAAISFDVRGDKICAYREYLGVIFQFKAPS